MDIRKVDGLWCDDITFCPEQCEWESCPRNSKNIRDRTIPHSYSVEIPQDCPKKQEGSVKVEMSEFDFPDMCIDCPQRIVVQCKDCKHGTPGACGDGIDCDGVWHDDDWFCADGERRE